ncbi:MAG TPA: DUF748 domain-containing protein [Candidatus Binatia bacterium]|nr:DUF748 domain-containing protein [Candidatus Binatia bacterium]
MGSRSCRVVVGLGVAVVLLAGATNAALRYATGLLKTHVEAALGPESEVGAIDIEKYTIVVRTLRMKAPEGWPTSDAFRAERVVVTPDLDALFSGDVRVGSVVAENVYLGIYREPDGRFRLLPSLLEKAAEETAEAETAGRTTQEQTGTPVAIEEISLRSGVIEIFDANIRKKPHRIRIEGIAAEAGPFEFPAFEVDTSLDIDGTVKGPSRDGRMSVSGKIRFSDLDSEIVTSLQGIDLVTFEPYLLQSTEAGVKRGTLDLEIRSKVVKRVLSAPGTMTLSHLELTGSTFMGLPRQAVLAAMKNRDDKITIRFDLGGRLDDPKFSLRENFAMRAGTAVAEGLGISVRGLATTLGGATQKLTDKLGDLLRR